MSIENYDSILAKARKLKALALDTCATDSERDNAWRMLKAHCVRYNITEEKLTLNEKRLRRLGELMVEWPAGIPVWHRGCGGRGIVMGWTIHSDGSLAVRVDHGRNGSSTDMPASLSKTKVSDGTDGDEWKEGAEV